MRLLCLLLLLSLSFSYELLTPESAYKMALENNKEILRLKHQIEAMDIDYELAQKYYLPVVYAGANLLYSFDKRDLKVETNLSVVSVLYEFQKTKSRIEISKIKRALAQLMMEQLKKDIQLRIIKLFAQAHVYKKLAEVKREEMAVAFVRFDRARERKELGLATDYEVAHLESIYREKRMELMKAQHLYNQSLLEIKRTVGLSYEVTIDLSPIPLTSVERDKFKELMELALKENTNLRMKDLEIKAYDEDLRMVGQTLSPSVSLKLSTNRSGLEISTPIFDTSKGYRIDYLLSLRRSAEVERRRLEDDIKLIFFNAPYELEYLKAKLEYARSRDRFMEENLMLRRSEYELELAFDLGNAMAEKSEAERQLLEAIYGITLFWAQLYNLAGKDPLLVLRD
ncbi:MAG: TolC family protein [Acidobacteria bacterium]|nr:MAG: TolC family protein [Acidobacteriota bacterium]